MESRADSITKNVSQMMASVDKAEVQLANVDNKLLALQRSHFIEHRIEEDDDYLAPVAEAIESTSQLNADETRTLIISRTITVLENCFDRTEFQEQGASGSSIVYQRRDNYKHKPLPYLIGSDEWRLHTNVGIGEHGGALETTIPIAIDQDGTKEADNISEQSVSVSWPSDTTPSTNSNCGLQSQTFAGTALLVYNLIIFNT